MSRLFILLLPMLRSPSVRRHRPRSDRHAPMLRRWPPAVSTPTRCTTGSHRDTIYTISSRDSPYSANYTPGVTDRGLAQRFGRDNMVRDCVRNTGTETDRSATLQGRCRQTP